MENFAVESISNNRDTNSIIENLFHSHSSKENLNRTALSRTESVENKPERDETVFISNERVEKIEKRINDYLKRIRTELQVEIHKETNTPIFKIVNKETKQVIAEIPPRRLLDIAAKMSDESGSFIDNNI